MPKKPYNHKAIESRWQREWAKKKLYKTPSGDKKPKCYVLDMFPYPSGEGLHIGHPKGYTATDIYARYKTMNGFAVLHPMGWDAFGLPAENFAIKNKVHPEVAVKKNIKRFKEQLNAIGFNYDWDREINTTDPDYYRFTQWIFLKLYEKGLAFQSFEPINWCPSCQTGLANEDLEGGKCERCGSMVEKRPMRQWVLRITKYADRLLRDLDKLDWPESIKESQRNWIGRSEGALIKFEIQNPKFENYKEIEVFTTRPDTLFGATFVAVSAELARKWLGKGWQASDEVKSYIEKTAKENLSRSFEEKEKTGVFSGIFAVNPANNEKIPVWIVNYVLGDVGTGAIMAVPAHDERDFEFAKKFKLSIKEVILGGDVNLRAYAGAGMLVNSGRFDGMENETAKDAITKFVGGKKAVTYKIKDWVFSRQRYWGEPIPVIHCAQCALSDPAGQGVVPVPERDLPVKLPKVKSYAPAGTGESPLATIEKWVNVRCPKCKGPAKRETNTMPQWAGSSWYYLRYIDPKNKRALVGKKKEAYWSPVDLYVGGAEHATRHLIYARFWHKFLYDIGAVNYAEPFSRLQHVGLILAEDGRKMSKRFGNVINPDDIVAAYGADTLRLYEMFMGPFSQAVAWSNESVIGPRRFLERVWKLQHNLQPTTYNQQQEANKRQSEHADLESQIHKAIKKITDDIESFGFNTAISALMILLNAMEKTKPTKKQFEILLLLLAPFAPHITEELWRELGHKKSIHLEGWPRFDAQKMKSEAMTIVVQVNGKVRGSFTTAREITETEAKERAQALPDIQKWLAGKEIVKSFYVKNKLVSFVVKG